MTIANNKEQEKEGEELFSNIRFLKKSLTGCFLFFVFNIIRPVFSLESTINPNTSFKKHFTPLAFFYN